MMMSPSRAVVAGSSDAAVFRQIRNGRGWRLQLMHCDASGTASNRSALMALATTSVGPVPHTVDGAAQLDRSRQVAFERGVILRALIGSIEVLIEQRLEAVPDRSEGCRVVEVALHETFPFVFCGGRLDDRAEEDCDVSTVHRVQQLALGAARRAR